MTRLTMLWQGNPALRWGLVFGLPVGALGAINTLLLFKGAGGVGNLPQFAVVVLLFFAAGMLATRETGDVSKSGLAGLFGGTLATILSGLVDVVLSVVAPRAYASMAGLDKLAQYQGNLILTVIIALLINILMYAAFGTVAGALGGLAARRLWQPTTTTPPSTATFTSNEPAQGAEQGAAQGRRPANAPTRPRTSSR